MPLTVSTPTPSSNTKRDHSIVGIISVSSVNTPSFLVLKPHFPGSWVDWLQLRPTWHPPWSKRKKLVLRLLDMLQLPEAQGNLPPETSKWEGVFSQFFLNYQSLKSNVNLKILQFVFLFCALGEPVFDKFHLTRKKNQESLCWSH